MHEPTYRQALSHGWQIVKRHPLLWFFGFFSLFLGQMGLVDIISQLSAAYNRSLLFPTIYDLGAVWNFIVEGMQAAGFSWLQISWLIVVSTVIIGSGVLLLFVFVTSHGALVHSVAQFVIHNNHGKVNVQKAWHAGTEHFWRIFAIQAVKRIALLLLGAALAVAWYIMSAYSGTWTQTVLFTLLFVLTASIGAVISFLAIYTVCYIVIDDQTLGQALHHAWNMFRSHWLVSLEVAAVLVGIQFAVLLIVIVLLLLYFAQSAVVWAISLMIGSKIVSIILSGLTSLLFVTVIACIGTYLSVFTTTVWTYLFIKMHNDGIVSRVVHSVKRLVRS